MQQLPGERKWLNFKCFARSLLTASQLSDYNTLQVDSNASNAAQVPNPLQVPAVEKVEAVTPQAPAGDKIESGIVSEREIQVDASGSSVIAPEHPDAEPGTPNPKGEGDANTKPAEASVEGDLSKEKILEQKKGKPQPASEKKEATV